jgi:hypothetical protein
MCDDNVWHHLTPWQTHQDHQNYTFSSGAEIPGYSGIWGYL